MIGQDPRYRAPPYPSYTTHNKTRGRGSGRWVAKNSIHDAHRPTYSPRSYSPRSYSPRSFSPARPGLFDHRPRSRNDSVSSGKSIRYHQPPRPSFRVFSNSGSRNNSYERLPSRDEMLYERRGKGMRYRPEHPPPQRAQAPRPRSRSPGITVWTSPDYHTKQQPHVSIQSTFPFPVTLADRSGFVSQAHSPCPIPLSTTSPMSPSLMPHAMSILMGGEGLAGLCPTSVVQTSAYGSSTATMTSTPSTVVMSTCQPQMRCQSVPLMPQPCTTMIRENQMSKSQTSIHHMNNNNNKSKSHDVTFDKNDNSAAAAVSNNPQVATQKLRPAIGPEDAVRFLPRGFQICPLDSPEKKKLSAEDYGAGDAGLAPGVWLSEQLGPSTVNPSQITVEYLLGNKEIGQLIQRLQTLQMSAAPNQSDSSEQNVSSESQIVVEPVQKRPREEVFEGGALEVRVDMMHGGRSDATNEEASVSDSGYSSSVCPSSFHPTPSTSPLNMDPLSCEMFALYKQTTQSKETFYTKKRVRDLLYSSVYHTFHHCGLYMVGSSSNGFGSDGSDLDLCLMIMPTEICQRTDAIRVLNLMNDCLSQNCTIVNKLDVIPARVPILRIALKEPFDKIEVDVNANMSVAIRNTHLLRHYAMSVDWRVQPLVLVVKHWAKLQCINDAAHSTLSSYTLVLMVIHFLQCGVHPPVVPSLQRLLTSQFQLNSDVRNLDYNPDTECRLNPTPGDAGFKSDNHQSLSELFLGFLDYFANDFNYETDAISVRSAKRLPREAVCRSRSPHNRLHQWHCLCIEEPFTSTNTALSVYDVRIFSRVKETFKRSYEVLKSQPRLDSVLGQVLVTEQPPILPPSVVNQSTE